MFLSITICLLAMLAIQSDANAQAALTGPSDGDTFSTTSTISVTGFIEDAVNTVYVYLKLQPAGTIQDSGSQVVQDCDPNDGVSYGLFSLDLEPPSGGWPAGDYVIEVWEDGIFQDDVQITIQ